MITLSFPLAIRMAVRQDMPEILALRDRQARAFVGRVNIPTNVQWIVAVDEHVRACAGFALATAEGHERKIIATDIYDDGTRTGKRALSMLLDDARQAIANGVKIFAIVPLDRPQLARHLERRGLHVSGFCLEAP